MRSHWLPPLLCCTIPFFAAPTDTATAGDPQEMVQIDASTEPITVGELLAFWRECEGVGAMIGPEAIAQKQEVPLFGIASIPRQNVSATVDSILREVGIVHVLENLDGVLTHSFVVANPSGRSNGAGTMSLKSRAEWVEPQEALQANHGRLITTAVTVEHLSARDAVNTLQPYFADSFTDSIRNVEGSKVIVMTSFAPTISRLLTMLQQIDLPQNKPEATIPVLQRITALEKTVAELQRGR